MEVENFLIDNVYFLVEGHTLALMRAPKGKGDKPADAIIPTRTPQGRTITSIGPSCCEGHFNKIVLSDRITSVEPKAFAYSPIDTVVWSENCKTISEECFAHSHIKKISNIHNVTEIGRSAFMGADIEVFNWPDGCSTIPAKCFYASTIKTIRNIKHVSDISEKAFAISGIEEFVWPSGCPAVPERCFAFSNLKSISNIDNVTEIGAGAFATSQLDKLDLSSLLGLHMAPGAFEGIEPQKVLFPYYISDDDLDYAFEPSADL